MIKEVWMIVLYPMIGVLLVAMLFAWFYLCHQMFKILRERHPETYEAMGRPSLVLNNSISNNVAFLRFLCARGWRYLGDPQLAGLGKCMIGVGSVYILLFLSIFILVGLGHVS